MKKRVLAAMFATMTVFFFMPSYSVARHLAEQYAERVERERAERMRDAARMGETQGEKEAGKRALEEKRRKLEEAEREAKRRETEDNSREESGEKEAVFPDHGEDAPLNGTEMRSSAEEEVGDSHDDGSKSPSAKEGGTFVESGESAKLDKKDGESEGRRNLSEKSGLGSAAEGESSVYAGEAASVKRILPDVSESGGMLLLSESPEYVRESGVLYRDLVSGNARVFYYHLNGTGLPHKLGVVLENAGDRQISVRVGRRGIGTPGKVYTEVGQGLQREYFADGRKEYVFSLKPGERRMLIDAMNDTILKPGELGAGMVDFSSSSRVRVSVLFCPAAENPLEYLGRAKILPPDEHRLRGTFVGMNRALRVSEYKPDKDGVSAVVLADGDNDTYCEGVDATDGSLVTNYGNCGVVYRLEIPIKNKIGLWLSPIGGDFAGVLRVDAGKEKRLVEVPGGRLSFESKSAHPPFDSNGKSTLSPSADISDMGVYGGKRGVFVEFSPPGASNMPIMIIMAPDSIKTEDK